jgi:adenylate kinase family enzyme
MKRIAIIGSGGAGKSTLARALQQKLGLPLIHLDAVFWKPGWVETNRAEWLEWQQNAVKAETWIMDGNYGGSMDVRIEAADTIIFLDLPPLLCAFRALKRWLQYQGRTRPDLPEGCPEAMDIGFLKWILEFRRTKRPGILEKLSKLEGKTVIRLRSSAEVKNFLRLEIV